MRATRTLAVVCGVMSFLVSACGQGAASDAAEVVEPAARAVAPGAVAIYDDALASGWVDRSWATRRNFAATSPVASGTRSLAVTFQAQGGLYFRRSGASMAGMSTLELSANGGSSAGQFVIRAVQGSTNLPSVSLAQYCTGGIIPARAWTRCRVPISALAPAGTTIDGFLLQEANGTARPVMYLDAVSLLPGAPAQPSGVTATASAGSVVVSWSAVAGATGYGVSRATSSSGPYTNLTASPRSGTTYADAAVVAGATYWYRVTATNAGGTSSPSASASATVPGGTTATSVSVYADALAAGWTDWSWGSTRDFAATSPVASGTRSLAVALQAWGGVYFRHTAGPVSGMTSFELSADGGTGNGDGIMVRAVQGDAELSDVTLAAYCAGGAIPTNAWTRCKVPLSVLAPAGGAIDGIILQEMSGTDRPTMYLDEVALTGASSTPPPALPSAPTNLAATASSGAVSLSWSAVSGATGYLVSRATAGGGPFTALSASPQAGTTYRDAAVAAGTTYWYRVAAVNAAGTGTASAAVSAGVPASVVTVSVSPATTSIDACSTAQFSAAVSGATDTSVTWSVQEGAAGGSIDSAGRYTAPSAAGTYHVVAVSKASSAVSAAVPVVVKDHVLSVTVTPSAPSLAAGAKQQFVALVTTSCGSFTAAAQ